MSIASEVKKPICQLMGFFMMLWLRISVGNTYWQYLLLKNQML
jgi:hypothetical protein